jgi:hypothetical protein
MAAGLSYADIVPTFEAAGVQVFQNTTVCPPSPGVCVYGTETFDSRSNGGFTTTFATDAGGSISGTYSSGYAITTHNEYGGAGGTGKYPELMGPNNSYTLSFTTTGDVPGVDYFGLWFPALDAGNLLRFYSGSTLLYSFTPADFIALVGACDGSNQYCGNPNYSNHTTNSAADKGEQFAFLNFFDTDPDAYITSVVFTQLTGSGFESDNHTVAYINPISVDSGTQIYGPEPGSFGLFVAGGILVALCAPRRRAA